MRSASQIVVVAAMWMWAPCCQPQTAPAWTSATAHAALKSAQARIVVLDVATGRILAANHLADAARTLAAPGSTLKPLALYGMIAAALWDPERRIACSRNLRIAGRSLTCSHPPTDPMDAPREERRIKK